MSRIVFGVLLVAMLTTCALNDDFDPNFSYADFMRIYERTYSGEELAVHEAAFNLNYAELLRLKSEGIDVEIN